MNPILSQALLVAVSLYLAIFEYRRKEYKLAMLCSFSFGVNAFILFTLLYN